MQRYRAAIVGLGNIAWRLGAGGGTEKRCLTHVEAFARHPLVTLAAGCSPDSAEQDAFANAFAVPAYSSLEELLARTHPDLVSICSPTEFHYEQVRSCLENAVPMIWLEKPPAGSIEELETLIALQQHSRSSRVLVNYQRRYTDCYQALKKVYRDKSLGTCRLVQINYSRGLETNGSHLLDLLFFIVGDHSDWHLDWVSAWEGTASPSFSLVIEGGPPVMISGLELPYHCIDVALICDEGRASILHGGLTPVCERRVEHEFFPGFYRLQKTGNELLGSCDIGMSMANALSDLLAAHEERREPESTLETACNAQLLMAEIRRKQGEGRQ